MNNRRSTESRLVLILMLLFLFTRHQNITAQEFTIKRLTTQDGLSHNNIRAIARDSTGFLWLATFDGLSRYDGYSFNSYYHVPNDSNSLQYFSVRNIKVDRYNNLWVHSDLKLLEKYNRNSDNFSLVNKLGGVTLDNVSLIDIDNEGLLLVMNENKIIKWDFETNEVNVLTVLDKKGQPYIFSQAFYNKIIITSGGLWVSGSEILHFFKNGDDNYVFDREYKVSENILKRIDFDYSKFFYLNITSNGNKWLLSNSGLYKLDEESGVFVQQLNKIPEGEFTGNKPIVWGDFYDGIYIYEPQGSVLKHITYEMTGHPMALMADSDNTLWYSGISPAGTALGLSHVIFTSGFFRNYLLTESDSTQPAIYSLAIDNKKNTWVGIRGHDDIVIIGVDGTKSSLGKLPPEIITHAGHIRAMSVTPKGIWVGYYMNLLRFFSYKDRKFAEYFPEQESAFRTILPMGDRIYYGTYNLHYFSPLTAKTEIVWRSNSNLSTYKLLPDMDTVLWCGMAKGTIAKVNYLTGKGRLIVIPPGRSNTEDIIKDRNGYLWLAFLGDGVCRYDPKTGETKFYTTQNGLSNNTTYSLMEDQSGNIWVSTNNGISRINPATGQIRKFGLTEGLKIHEFNSGAKFRTEDSEFLFGGMGGFVRFYPDNLSIFTNQNQKQKIIFTGFNVSGNKKILPGPINESDTIFLKPGENNFQIWFSASDFRNADNTRYRYKLGGIDKEWIETGKENRDLNYSNLKPGYYTLYLEPNDINGNWAGARTLVIRIQPRIFQTKAFLIGIPALIVMLIISLILIYIRQVRFKERQKQETLRLQALQGQMNPHFIFNSLNSINYFISNNDKLSANRYIADFAKLIRSILHNMNYNYISLDNEIESIEDYLKIEHLRFGDKFNYKIEKDSRIKPDELKVSPGLVQPFVENAIWHGIRGLENRKGNITIRFGLDDGKLICEIEDDGIGRKRSSEMISSNGQKRSRGISIINERLRILSGLHNKNYQLTIDDLHPERKDPGTRIVIDLPIENG